MNRRDALGAMLALGATIVPSRVTAQASVRDKPFRIAALPDLAPVSRDPFLVAMGDLGWRQGRDFLVEQTRAQVGEGNFDEAAKRVAESMPDLIVVLSTAYALAAIRATKTIPIVMIFTGYPVEAGLADSLARPGKNVTGNSIYAGTEVWAKLILLLLEAKPSTRRVSVLWSYVSPAFPKEEIEPCYAELRNAERALGVKVDIIETARSEQVPAALARIGEDQPDALQRATGLPVNLRATITHFAVEKRLPSITDLLWETAVGQRIWPPFLIERNNGSG
jgi:putative tryptophan/tyrosine transport system substrate-binding protein